jgi:hypothetical protein
VINLMDALRKSIEKGKRSEPAHKSAANAKTNPKKTGTHGKGHTAAKRRKAG